MKQEEGWGEVQAEPTKRKYMKGHILVVDDEEDILELVNYNLSREGYQVSCAASGEKGLQIVKKEKPDLLVLDLMLPGVDGFDVCRRVRENRETEHIPIVMLSAKGEESDIVTGLELGADDYLVKPFSPRVLLARVKTVLRRARDRAVGSEEVVERDGIVIDPARHEVRVEGDAVDLSATEFRVLHSLAQAAGRVFTRQQIVHAVHGDSYPVTDRSVDVQVVGLRKKLGDYGRYIETVRGVGYRFRE